MRSTTRWAAGRGTAVTGPPRRRCSPTWARSSWRCHGPQRQLHPADRAERQSRLEGFNERIVALYGRGLSTRDIRAHLREMYDVEVSPDLISRVTDVVLEELTDWQSRPLDAVYPVVFIDAIMVKIRDGVVANRPVHLAIGIDCEGSSRSWACASGPPPASRASSGSRSVGVEVPRGGRRVHPVLRRAHGTAGRRRGGGRRRWCRHVSCI